jgi:hypothetical protein
MKKTLWAPPAAPPGGIDRGGASRARAAATGAVWGACKARLQQRAASEWRMNDALPCGFRVPSKARAHAQQPRIASVYLGQNPVQTPADHNVSANTPRTEGTVQDHTVPPPQVQTNHAARKTAAAVSAGMKNCCCCQCWDGEGYTGALIGSRGGLYIISCYTSSPAIHPLVLRWAMQVLSWCTCCRPRYTHRRPVGSLADRKRD